MAERDLVETIIDGIIAREGGLIYSDRTADRGGPTKAGITLGTLKWWHQRTGLAPATAEDVRDLGEATIRRIYRTLFVYEPRFDLIEDDQLREHTIDAGVLHGPFWAARRLQELIGVKVDGRIGPITLAAIHAADPDRLNIELGLARLDLFVGMVVKDARDRGSFVGQLENLRGWFNRVTAFIVSEAKH